jgi:polyhydroxybutyrate depolymerase
MKFSTAALLFAVAPGVVAAGQPQPQRQLLTVRGADGFRASSGCGRTPAATPGTATAMSGSFNGTTRSWTVWVPSGYTSNTAVPLIISHHGWGGSGKQDMSGGGLASTGGNYIAVFPNGYADNSNVGSWGSWNCVGATQSPGTQGQTCLSTADPQNTYCYTSCNGCSGASGCDWTTCTEDITPTGVGNTNVNGFIPQLYDYMEENFCIDTTREYAAGFSNGGMFTYQSGASQSSRLAAIAPVAGSFHNGFNQVPTVGVPLLDTHGTSDTTVPANSTTSGDGWHYTLVSGTIMPGWVAANGCSSPQASAYTNTGISASSASQYKLGCVSWGCNVVTCAWNGGHAYFGSSSTNSALVWNFLQQFSKPNHVGKGLLVGQQLPADYELQLTNVTVLTREAEAALEKPYVSTGINIANPPRGFSIGALARPHYGNPSQGCRIDEEKIVLSNGLLRGEVCAPKRKTKNSAEEREGPELVENGESWASCTLGGMWADASNGCPTDLPGVNNGTLAAFPQCSMDGGRASFGNSVAHCYLTCDPCRNNGFDDCDSAAHDMCPQGAVCMLGTLRHTKQGVCVYNSNARPAKYHLVDAYKCYEMTYTDKAFAAQGYVAGECDSAFSTIDAVNHELICDGDSTKNIKDCPDTQVYIDIAQKSRA